VWPLPLLIPLTVYGCFVAMLRPLRQTSNLRIGIVNGRLVACTAIVSVLSLTVLVLYQIFFSPSLEHLDKYLPLALVHNVFLTAVAFSLLNPLLEEIVFRGVFYQAIGAHWPWPVAVIATAVLFGVGHMGGYPPGGSGALLAGIYGVALGALRHYSEGLLLPVLAHIVADATIASIRLY